jgi:hypothetical protein
MSMPVHPPHTPHPKTDAPVPVPAPVYPVTRDPVLSPVTMAPVDLRPIAPPKAMLQPQFPPQCLQSLPTLCLPLSNHASCPVPWIHGSGSCD